MSGRLNVHEFGGMVQEILDEAGVPYNHNHVAEGGVMGYADDSSSLMCFETAQGEAAVDSSGRLEARFVRITSVEQELLRAIHAVGEVQYRPEEER